MGILRMLSATGETLQRTVNMDGQSLPVRVIMSYSFAD